MSIFEEAPRGGAAELWALSASGRERLEMFGTHLPRPPYAHLLGIELEGVDGDDTVLTMPATGWLLSPQGRIPLGVVAVLADISLGSALETRLGPGSLYTTSEMSLQRIGTASTGGDLRATGQVIYAGADVALTQTSIVDGTGRLVVHGSSRLAMLDSIGDLPPVPDPLPALPADEHDTPDPYLREPQGEVLDPEVWDRQSGIDVVRAQVDGELPPAPLFHLTGITPTEVTEGSVTVTMPAHPWLANHFGTIHGGFLATLGDAALQLAIQSTTDAGNRFAPLDFKINYLRPVAPDLELVTARARVAHRGRSVAVASAEIVNAAGKTVAMVTGSAMFAPKELLA